MLIPPLSPFRRIPSSSQFWEDLYGLPTRCPTLHHADCQVFLAPHAVCLNRAGLPRQSAQRMLGLAAAQLVHAKVSPSDSHGTDSLGSVVSTAARTCRTALLLCNTDWCLANVASPSSSSDLLSPSAAKRRSQGRGGGDAIPLLRGHREPVHLGGGGTKGIRRPRT